MYRVLELPAAGLGLKKYAHNSFVTERCSPVGHTATANTGRSLHAFGVDAACIPRLQAGPEGNVSGFCSENR